VRSSDITVRLVVTVCMFVSVLWLVSHVVRVSKT
jgi:hypothetical protein